ncbi:uncharacterized protein PHALS_01208 [Plasmopara halstedii]|uniref:Uncharacterized protein n=1 Tax=Plasmopara halstedii TaxID=4781 RepID=A0A0P1ATB8_PLAHL|nr:uncharacterized protein PHALS_01208 [Plasmopara halstedii]CEG44878.1 hypothetical protein PHALS_01208 [Plasmopara halstedii]|eukprot:XP_024581247.1 hypothetical protein PHALS_01208 [Plasmopara halstedii]
MLSSVALARAILVWKPLVRRAISSLETWINPSSSQLVTQSRSAANEVTFVYP